MKKPDFVYVTYIATTPEKVWLALTEVDLMRQWWVDPKAGCARVNLSDWKPGSTWNHQRADGSDIVDILGKVVEFTPPRKMVMTWARPSEEHDLAKHARRHLRRLAHDTVQPQDVAGNRSPAAAHTRVTLRKNHHVCQLQRHLPVQFLQVSFQPR